MYVAHGAGLGGYRRERSLNLRDPFGRRIASGQTPGLQRLDMRLDLDLGTELVAQRGLQGVGDLVRSGERQVAVDLEIERHR
jgi:hypothetical protein